MEVIFTEIIVEEDTDEEVDGDIPETGDAASVGGNMIAMLLAVMVMGVALSVKSKRTI